MRIGLLAKLVAVEQTVFGLPWVLTAAVIPFFSEIFAAQFPWDQWTRWVGIVGGFVSARTAGMAFNRLIDREIDAANPRTRDRLLPRGEVTPSQVVRVACVSSLCLMLCGALINRLMVVLSPLVILLLGLYSYTKRVTSLCHFFLGMIHFCGPVLAWIAIADSCPLAALVLGAALLCSIAAGDIVYALQDLEFDKAHELFSLPKALGPQPCLVIARLLHFCTLLLLCRLGLLVEANALFYVGIAIMGVVYFEFHWSIDLSQVQEINRSFGQCHTRAGLVLFLSTVGSVLWRVWF